jgi:hypothetical protein
MKFDMGRAWGDAARLLGANSGVIAIVAGVFFFLPNLAMTLLLANSLSQITAVNPQDATAAFAEVFALYGRIWWIFPITGIAQVIGLLALLSLLADRQRPTVGEALVFGATAFFPYLGAMILLYLALLCVLGIPIGLAYLTGSTALIVIVALLAFVALLYVATKFSLVPAVMATERVLNPVKAIARSWQLTRGNSVRIFLFYVLLAVVLVVVALVVSMVGGVVFALLGSGGAIVGNGIFSSALNAVWLALFMAVLAAVHHQLAGTSTAGLAETFE